jgi:D-sedoheptulose 7-phosphate isomerase
MSFSSDYIQETKNILDNIDWEPIDHMVDLLVEVRQSCGRLFIIGVGGSAGTASHAVNDFRKICDIQAFCPTDNVSELTARINDEGWSTVYSNWLEGSQIVDDDAILILSVGGGDEIAAVSIPIINAIQTAHKHSALVLGIVGRDGGYTAKKAHCCVIIPPMYSDRITPHTEGLASVVLHCIVSHPDLKANPTKWEGLDKEKKAAT